MPNPPQHAAYSALNQVKRKRVKAVKAKALKTHELDSSPKAKYKRLRRHVRSLVYENGALCDETARAQRLVLQAQEERRFLLQKLIQLEQQSAAGPTPAPLAAAAATGARPVAPAPSIAAPSASLAGVGSGAGSTAGRANPVSVATAAAVPNAGRQTAGMTLSSHGAARSVAPLAAVSGTSSGRASASLVAAAVSGRSSAPLAAVPGTSAGRPITVIAAGSSAGRLAASAVAPAPVISSAGLRSSVPVAVAVARSSTGRVPASLALVTGTGAGRLSAPLVMTPATNAGRLTSPLVVATGVGATRLSAPLVVPAGTTHPPALTAQPGISSQPLVAAVGTTSSQWRPAPAFPSPRASTTSTGARRASRPPRRLVSAVPRDPAGSVRLPLQLGTLILQSPGRIIPDRPAYHSASALYPAGFVSLRRFISVASPRRSCVLYRCVIEDGGTHPRFSIAATAIDPTPRESDTRGDSRGETLAHARREPRDESAAPSSTSSSTSTSTSSSAASVSFVGRTADDCHRQLLQRVSGALGRPLPAACRVAGEAFFGLTHPSVQQILQGATGAALCGRYRPVLFELTDRMVPVQAESEPGLSAATLWQRLGEDAE